MGRNRTVDMTKAEEGNKWEMWEKDDENRAGYAIFQKLVS